MADPVKQRVVLFLSCIIHLFMLQHASSLSSSNYTSVHIGVVLDSNSSIGSMAEVCMSMALSDFYAVNSNYKTRLFLHTKLAQHQLDVTSQVLELLEKEEVHGIVGSQELTEGNLIEEIGKRVQIPIISFTSRSPSDLDPKNQYFVRTTPDNSNQLKALAAICKGFEWNQVTVLYEDTESGREFFSELNKALQVFDIQLSSVISVSPLASDYHINKDLERVMKMQNRVFLVHMNVVLGSRLFVLAKSIGMMTEDYAWIVTDSIGNSLNSMDSTVIEAMEGVIGVRAFVPISKNLKSFRERFRHEKHETSLRELNVYGLLAYDTVWALAMASEMIGPINSSFSRVENGENGSSLSSLAISNFGPKLVHQLFDVGFEGLSGEFKLINGNLKPTPLEIFNVIGTGGRTIGYWTPDGGIAEKPSPNREVYSTSTKELRTIVWPGDSVVKPKGWAIPLTGKLKVGIPKKTGFTEFVRVSEDPLTNQTNATGFSIDIFLAALQLLPFKLDYKYMAYVDDSGSARGTYSDLVRNISTQYDIVVGDTTILADRAAYVDFTLPYYESGIVIVVKNKQDTDMWVFFKPFRWDLWVTIIATCIFIGIVLRILEHRAKSGPDNVRPHKEQKSLLFWFPIEVLAFPERNIVNTNWSRFVLVVWLYTSYVVMQSYTAKLSSMFTVDQLNFKLSQDINVGYQEGSFVKDFLANRLHFSESKLKQYTSVEDIHDGMSKGSKNGGFDAIVDEIPYMKLLLNRYGSVYKMVGPTYKTDGFGFACPLNSPLVPYFSRAILSVTESPTLKDIEQKNFGPEYSSDNQIDSINKDNPSLTVYDFGGLFIIFGSSMLFAIFFSWNSVTSKLVMARQYGKNCLLFLSFGGTKDFRTDSIVHPAASDDSSSEQEVEMHEQINVNNSIVDHQVEHNGSNRVSGQPDVNESNQTEGIQQSQPNHLGR